MELTEMEIRTKIKEVMAMETLASNLKTIENHLSCIESDFHLKFNICLPLIKDRYQLNYRNYNAAK